MIEKIKVQNEARNSNFDGMNFEEMTVESMLYDTGGSEEIINSNL